MQRFDIVNFLIRRRGYVKYLEIGVLDNVCFNQVQCDFKDSVDPNGNAKYTMTSDEFFKTIMSRSGQEGYDIIFIDGLHVADQVLRDINNSLACLNHEGIIVMHDCLPATEEQQLPEPVWGRPWTGTAWHAFAALRSGDHTLSMATVDTDCGIGLIERGQQKLWHEPAQFTWDYFVKNRNELMNVISIPEFIRRY
jgi:Methyltransferase domain